MAKKKSNSLSSQIFYMENPKESTHKFLELIEQFSNVAGYKINAQKSVVFLFLFFFKDFIHYLTERETAREGTQAVGVGEREAGFLLSREPDAEFDPGTLGS